MDTFIQLSYSEQCPQKTAKPQEIALVNKGKVSEHFWLDLLERKCPEGLGEVSEGLVNDENLTPADFLDDLNASSDAGASQQTKTGNDCYTDFKPVNGDQFKTPVTSRYSHKITETPSLFSQDESTICSPTSSLKSQPTGHGDEQYNQAETSPDPSQTPTTPMGLSRYKIGCDWSARRSTTPDILAEILGQKESTLSRLLAGGHEDEIAEWSESMATPPLKTTEPAGDPSDCQTDGEKTHENLMGEEGQIPAKRIARVLFSGCIADQSIEATELSLDEVKVKEKSLVQLKNKDSTLQTAPRMGAADSSLIEEEFVMEYCCHEESKRSDVTLSEPLPGMSKLTSSAKKPLSRIDADVAGKTTYISPPSAKASLIHSPLPNNFLSPKSQSPFHVLAQSTPKRSFKDDQHKGKNRLRINDKIVTTYHDTSLPRDTNVHNCSLDQLCDISKMEVHVASGDNSYADELDCKLEVKDVTFGSPSRSFELAMAREADKLCSGMEKDSRTSGLGSSLSVSLNAQSQNIDDELNKSTVSQPIDCIQETAQITKNGTTLQTLVGKNIIISSAPVGESLHDRSYNYVRKRSFGKVPGIRRSARTKRFSYPSASQVTEHHIRKSVKRTFTNDDVSSTAKEENRSIKEEKGSVNCEMYDDSPLCTILNCKDSNIEMPLSKRLKFEGLSAFRKSENDLNPSPIVNSKEKDVFLYDMDALTQFPMECICSPPLGLSRPHLEKKEDVTESVKPGELVFFYGSKEPSSWCTEEEELQPVYGNTRAILGVSHSRAVASLDEGKYPPLADEIVEDDDQVWENNLLESGKLKITALHGPQSRGFEPTKADNCQYFGRFSPEKTGVYVSSEDSNIKSCVTDETGFTGFKTSSGKHVPVTLEAMEKAKAAVKKIDDSLGLIEGESKQVLRHLQPEVSTSCNATQNNGLTSNLNDVSLKQRVEETSDENLTGFERVQSSVLPGFCRFSTASGNQIHISQSAMRRARKTLSEVDINMKASRIVHDKGVEKAKEDPCFFMERGERDPVNGFASADNINDNLGKKGEIPLLKNAISDEPCLQQKTSTKTNRIVAFSSVVAREPASGNDDPDFALATYIPIEGKQRDNAPLGDHSKKNSSTARADEKENKDITLQSPTHVVGGSINKNVHDSLLEDLLNDFKCKRRDSLITISEESDKVEEPEINTTSAVNSSCELRQKLCNDEYSVECNGNVLTEILPDDAGKNTAWRTSIKVSEETTALSTTMQSGENIAPPISFSGFQTASGQQVKPSAESMEKGAAIIQEIGSSIQHNKDTNASPTTFPGFQTASGKLVKLSAESMEKGAAIMQNIDNSLQCNRDITQTSSTFSGFQTASGKLVKLSAESMEKGVAIMQNIDNSLQCNRDITQTSSTFPGFQTASGKLVKLSAESMEKGVAIMQNIDNSLQCNRDITQTSSTFPGFQTASGKLVKLSAESMEKGAAIMQNIDNSLQCNRDITQTSSTFSGFQTASGKLVKLSAESMEKGVAIMQNIDNSLQCNRDITQTSSTFSGFQTASGKLVKLSAESMEKGVAIMQNIDNSLQCNRDITQTSSTFSGFQTASGQKVKLSERSLEKGAAIMQEIDNSIQHNRDVAAPSKAFSGFQTASGKLVKLSAESMEKGVAIMQNIDNSLQCNRDITQTSSTFSGFQTASGQKVKLSERSLEKGAAIMQEIDNSIQHNRDVAAPSKAFSGFQTASGKLVKLSAESMEKGVAIMQNIDNFLQRNRETTQTSSTFSGFQTATGQKVKLSERSLEKGAAIMQEIDNSIQHNRDAAAPSKAFSGFQTASGKLVKLSAESMEKGVAIMQNIDNSLQCNRDITQTSSTFSGFQTASGQKVKLSKRSMEKGAAIMQEIDNSIQHNKDTTATPKFFSGFQTAHGQLVKLSAESMEKEAAIMQKIDNSLQQNRETATPPSAFSGFQTANGQQVTLSEESMKKGAAIMQQIDNSIQQCKEISAPSTGFSSFQTASGQKVKISAESMEKGTALMQEIDNFLQQSRETNVPPNAFSGFQTASGQKFKLSEGSVEKGATTMQQNHSSVQQNKDISAPSTGFSGFQTASGQKVKLSAESMKEGTAIMQEIDNFLHRNKENTLSETASGQKVNFEKQSIERGMAIMRQIDKSIEQNKGSSSLENGAAYLQKADQSFQKNIDGNEPTNCSSESSANVTSVFFSGFQTANGKTVQISESALAKAKDAMASIENDIQKSRSGTEGISDDSLFKRMNGWKPVDQDSDTLINDCHVVTAVVPGRSRPLHDGHCSVEHDDAVSREILESSEALLAYESSLDVSEYDKASVAWDSLSTSAVSMTGSAKGLSHCFKKDPQRRHSTPVKCGEDRLNRTHRDTRSGMKPCSTTPSGLFHDRRVHFRAPLRARLATVENTCASRGSDSTRSLNPLRATTPDCFKTKHSPSPRTSTPLNANAMHWTSAPRPLFMTPYRNREVSTVVSPLARCSSSSFPVSESPKPLVTDLMVPSAKKARVSSPNWSSKMKRGQLDTLSKCNERVKPLPGFLSGLRRHNQRIKLKDYVGIGTLPGRHTVVELLQLGLSPEVISVTSTNAVSFRLCGRRYLSETALLSGEGVRTEDGGLLHIGSDGCIGLEEIQSAFLTTPGVDSQLISEEWIANHYKWLVWKLAAMEVAFPCHFAGRCLTPDWLLCQLKYRYDKEIDSSDRSALKKIMERDDVSSRTMVLCVSSVTVTEDDTEKEAVEHNDNQGDKDGQSRTKMASCAIIEVTDGWYSIRAILDTPLTELLHNRKIFVGQKLIVCGAELVGSEQAVSPLEGPSTLMLRLHANSTRRARWDAKLGFHSHTLAFPLPLSSLFSNGGFTGCVDIIVLRQYPVQWMEKMPDGTNVFRNSRLEEREAKKFEADRHQRREKLFLKIQEEFEKECLEPERERRRSARFRRRSFVPSDLKDLHDGKEIYEALSQATDPDAIKGCLDERQLRALEEYQRLSQEGKFAELQSKFERTWREQEEECQLQRNVVPLLKVRIADYLLRGRDRQNAVLSIWRPSEEVMQLSSEGSRLRIYHLTASGVRYRQGVSEVQLSATRTTRYQDLSSDPEVKRIVYVPRKVCSFQELRCNSSHLFSEVDLVGLVIFCSPLSSFSGSSSNVQTVYLSDEESNIVAIKVWGGLKAVAVEDVVKAGNFICCSNLTVRQDDRLQCPFLTFWELSNVSMKPREPHLRNALKTLQQSIQDLRLFMSQIQEKLDVILYPNRASLPENLKVDAEALHSTGKEIGPSLLSRPSSCIDVKVSHQSDDSSLEIPNQAAHEVNPGVKLRHSKRKLLESIPEPPPLSPLPNLIPASVRREFKTPRRAESLGNIHRK